MIYYHSCVGRDDADGGEEGHFARDFSYHLLYFVAHSAAIQIEYN